MNRIDGIRSHIGSRAISVQVNNVAVSDHVFHRFSFDLLNQVFANQLSLFLCISFVLMATDRVREDAKHTALPAHRLYLRMLVLLMVLVATSMEWAPAPEVLLDEKLDALLSKFVHFEAQCSHDMDVPKRFTYLENTWRFRESTYRDGTEFQCHHRSYVQV